ncbi:pyruvate, phosphate dikinase [Alicyclobacillus sp. SO9]|uniref:pyruvate, phosphate dikinase n=1 Tax=Alicyclobacillus sp. SO9 TaxID=2665646 RepID=UPI00351C7330
MMNWVYSFTDAAAANLGKEQLGGKGHSLALMTQGGLPVPPGFTITTDACHVFHDNQRALSEQMIAEIETAVAELEAKMEKRFGDTVSPLLVSVRSGAPISMPGMMDTILNLGLNEDTVEALARQTGNSRFAYDSYRRFIQMFGDVVQGIPHYKFEQNIENVKADAGVQEDQKLDAGHWQMVVQRHLALVERETGKPFPQDPKEQLLSAIEAVFDSWNNQRAIVYRKVNKIPDELGTAVNVQSMVFGNLGDDSATGVAFTRNPSTGENGLYGEYLVNAQGEDVVAGIRTPKSIQELAREMPEAYNEFVGVCNHLEGFYKDVQDIEFTIEQGKLFLLQTRNAKRTAAAAIKIAVDMVNDGVIDRETALTRVDIEHLSALLHPRLDPDAQVTVLGSGLPASPGAVSGQIVFNADDAEALAKLGKKILLVRTETTPEDIHGILAAQGILTSRGGMTSHAAVVARGMGKPCVCGCDSLYINPSDKTCTLGNHVFNEGDTLSIDGSTGRVILGEVQHIEPKISDEFTQLLEWAEEVKRLEVRANADNPADAARAAGFGAVGIGLCRTEHMFMAPERVPVVQSMILSRDTSARKEALNKLLPMQQEDFYGILKAMDGYPVTIRLLDPPLHEFLPNLETLIARQTELKVRLEYNPDNADLRQHLTETNEMLATVRSLNEVNPMLGHRGCRLGMTFPEVYEMQVRAIYQAAADLVKDGYHPVPEVMIPLAGHVAELRRMRKLVEDTAREVQAERGSSVPVVVGTMIEVPRAALTADEMAQEAEFFSFGTNDLTQTTFGYSRDDAEGKFLQTYLNDKVLQDNPFEVLDRDGVGRLIKIATSEGRKAKPQLKVGICGEHGGEQHSIAFCHEQNLTYVSCSPFRVPLARLAAAQAAIRA